MSQQGLPPDIPGPPKSRLAVLGEKTLVPLGIALLTAGAGISFGYNYRDHEATKDEAVAAKITSLNRSVELARSEIMMKLDSIASSVIADHAAMLTKDDFDNVWRLAKALNPAIVWPERSR
jgi:hypothetical protein